MSTLWAITSGEYSDYNVDAVFDTEEDARAAIALGLGEEVERKILWDNASRLFA